MFYATRILDKGNISWQLNKTVLKCYRYGEAVILFVIYIETPLISPRNQS